MKSLPLTIYCERTSDLFWAEPFNGLSNAAFLIVAIILALRAMHRISNTTLFIDIWLLICLTGMIGIGSFLWHTTTARWAQYLDVASILLYMSIFLPSFLHRMAGSTLSVSVGWLLGFYIINLIVYSFTPASILNGSIYYIPSMLTLLYLSKYNRQLIIPGAWFMIGILFRSMDLAICEWFTAGSHFLWHFCVSLVILQITTLLIDKIAASSRSEISLGR